MGGDFTYSNALMWYKNLDKLVALVNAAADNSGRYQVTTARHDASSPLAIWWHD
jgi:hypothetical protein